MRNQRLDVIHVIEMDGGDNACEHIYMWNMISGPSIDIGVCRMIPGKSHSTTQDIHACAVDISSFLCIYRRTRKIDRSKTKS